MLKAGVQWDADGFIYTVYFCSQYTFYTAYCLLIKWTFATTALSLRLIAKHKRAIELNYGTIRIAWVVKVPRCIRLYPSYSGFTIRVGNALLLSIA